MADVFAVDHGHVALGSSRGGGSMGIELRMRLSECAFGLSHVALDSSRGDSLLPGMPPLVPPRGDECAFSHCYIAMDRS